MIKLLENLMFSIRTYKKLIAPLIMLMLGVGILYIQQNKNSTQKENILHSLCVKKECIEITLGDIDDRGYLDVNLYNKSENRFKIIDLNIGCSKKNNKKNSADTEEINPSADAEESNPRRSRHSRSDIYDEAPEPIVPSKFRVELSDNEEIKPFSVVNRKIYIGNTMGRKNEIECTVAFAERGLGILSQELAE